MRTHYDLTNDFSIGDDYGNDYKDIFSIPYSKYYFNTQPEEYTLTTQDIERFDLLLWRKYNTVDLDDIILFVNGIDSIFNLSAGDKIFLPVLTELLNFYNKNRV